jgi:hypothetical protein
MKHTIYESKYFIVFVEDKGYFAEKQTTQRINFTDDYTFSKKYRTKKGATNSIKKISEEIKNKKFYVQPIKVTKVLDVQLDRMESIKLEEEKNVIKFVETKLNVNVVVDDDFWK